MRSVQRPAIPASLRKNADRWIKELTDLLLTPNPDPSKIKKRQKHYNQPDIKNTLEQMYQKLCCYCESRIGTASYGQIEHRKLKSEFPKLTFDWNNLHWACEVCNRSKGKQWNNAHSILDSAQDCIAEHLGYRIEKGRRWPKSDRGRTTIDHAKLNRQELIEARTKIALSIGKIQRTLRNDPCSPAAELLRERLQGMRDGDYGSFVSCSIRHFSYA